MAPNDVQAANTQPWGTQAACKLRPLQGCVCLQIRKACSSLASIIQSSCLAHQFPDTNRASFQLPLDYTCPAIPSVQRELHVQSFGPRACVTTKNILHLNNQILATCYLDPECCFHFRLVRACCFQTRTCHPRTRSPLRPADIYIYTHTHM